MYDGIAQMFPLRRFQFQTAKVFLQKNSRLAEIIKDNFGIDFNFVNYQGSELTRSSGWLEIPNIFRAQRAPILRDMFLPFLARKPSISNFLQRIRPKKSI